MITRKLNPRVYDSLLVLLDAVRLYRVYRRLDTLPLYSYYELLILLLKILEIYVCAIGGFLPKSNLLSILL